MSVHQQQGEVDDVDALSHVSSAHPLSTQRAVRAVAAARHRQPIMSCAVSAGLRRCVRWMYRLVGVRAGSGLGPGLGGSIRPDSAAEVVIETDWGRLPGHSAGQTEKVEAEARQLDVGRWVTFWVLLGCAGRCPRPQLSCGAPRGLRRDRHGLAGEQPKSSTLSAPACPPRAGPLDVSGRPGPHFPSSERTTREDAVCAITHPPLCGELYPAVV